MSSCSHEAHGHHDGHSHGAGHGHSHGPGGDNPERGLEFSLFQHIDTSKVVCLNGAGSAGCVFRPFQERLDTTKHVDSDADEQMIFQIPFTGEVILKSICVIGGGDRRDPKTLKVFVNRDDIDFDSVDSCTPVQQFDLNHDREGNLEYPTRISKFQGVRKLVLFFSDNYGADSTRIQYIGLKGEFKQLKKDITVTVYELNANPADHKKVDNPWMNTSSVE